MMTLQYVPPIIIHEFYLIPATQLSTFIFKQLYLFTVQ